MLGVCCTLWMSSTNTILLHDIGIRAGEELWHDNWSCCKTRTLLATLS